MWWEPRTEEDGYLASIISRMDGLFLEYRRRGTVFGVGSILLSQLYRWRHWAFTDYWRKLPLWHRLAECFGRRGLFSGISRCNGSGRATRGNGCGGWRYHWAGRDFAWRSERTRFDNLLPLVLLNQDLADEPIFPMTPYFRFDLPIAAQEEVGQWDLPDETVFLFVSAPEAVSSSAPVVTLTGRLIRCAKSGEVGTAGVRLWAENAARGTNGAFLTVGHMFPDGKDSDVEAVKYGRPRWLRLRHYERCRPSRKPFDSLWGERPRVRRCDRRDGREYVSPRTRPQGRGRGAAALRGTDLGHNLWRY